MKWITTISWGLAFLVIISACNTGQDHFITDAGYREKVKAQFEKRKELAKNRTEELFGVFGQGLNTQEREALEFLYAYMPLNDLADYDGELFLQNVRVALEAEKTFPWGGTIPEEIFRHFVLPYRINTENLDSARTVFFHELKDRIINMPLKEAVLEVNHWCHEKVTYRGTDRRTSAPLATVNTAYGRCGEETVFTIAALRAVGIPARQCYVPRWAHTESNHAWVEVWIDGTWYYLGACEPEPDLNMAWFTEPVKRAMLLSSIVFGDYDGLETVTEKENEYTRINTLAMYAPVRELFVNVRDKTGNPAADALVEFQIFNFGQFSTLAEKSTGDDGMCSVTLGLGDVMIWAHQGNDFGYEKISVEERDTVTIIMGSNPGESYIENLVIAPPPVADPTPVSDEGREENSRRLLYEDSLRNAYELSFIDSVSSHTLAVELGLASGEVWSVLKESRGNGREIAKFLRTVTGENRKWALALLSAVSDKDLHDTGRDVFLDHLTNAVSFRKSLPEMSDEDFTRYVLSPKAGSEILTAYKSYFQNVFDEEFKERAREDGSVLFDWITSHISIDEKANYYEVPITPRGVYELKVSDAASRNIFFVALCRSFGIPARTSFMTRNPEYFMNGRWNEVDFTEPERDSSPGGYVRINNISNNRSFDPRPFANYRFFKFSGGVYNSAFIGSRMPRGQGRGRGAGGNDFSKPQRADAGNYLLIAANRLEDGTVLARLSFFTVHEGKTVTVDLDIPARRAESKVYGTIDLQSSIVLLENNKKITLAGESGQNGLILVWIDPDREPTKHAMGDFQSLRNEFDARDAAVIFLLQKGSVSSAFDPETYTLPKNHVFALDTQDILKTSKITAGANLPVIMVVNEKGEVTFVSEGYRIGIGEQVIKALAVIR